MCLASEWTCFNRRCIIVQKLCDGNDDCGDGSDESYAIARCRGMSFLCEPIVYVSVLRNLMWNRSFEQ
jgi:hypothetical protein